MGHKNIAVLDGGLPAWKSKGYPLEKIKKQELIKGNFKAEFDSDFFIDYKTILNDLPIKESLVIDARSADRFFGLKEEPRKGLRAGHIPGSKNLPYDQLLDGFNLKPANELKAIFTQLNKKQGPLVFSCGSGITACILALGAEVAGQKKLTVYDGSWTEWGSLNQLPIEK